MVRGQLATDHQICCQYAGRWPNAPLDARLQDQNVPLNSDDLLIEPGLEPPPGVPLLMRPSSERTQPSVEGVVVEHHLVEPIPGDAATLTWREPMHRVGREQFERRFATSSPVRTLRLVPGDLPHR